MIGRSQIELTVRGGRGSRTGGIYDPAKIVLAKECCQDFHIAILDQVTLMVGFSTIYSYGVTNIRGNNQDDHQSKRGGV